MQQSEAWGMMLQQCSWDSCQRCGELKLGVERVDDNSRGARTPTFGLATELMTFVDAPKQKLEQGCEAWSLVLLLRRPQLRQPFQPLQVTLDRSRSRRCLWQMLLPVRVEDLVLLLLSTEDDAASVVA